MKIYIAVLISFLLASSVQASRLKDEIPNIESSYNIVTKYEHPISYLNQLKVLSPKAKLSQMQKYELARHLLDVHYLCLALSHQGYMLKLDHPVVALAIANFPDLSAYRAEGGHIFTHAFGEYFEQNTNKWSPSGP